MGMAVFRAGSRSQIPFPVALVVALSLLPHSALPLPAGGSWNGCSGCASPHLAPGSWPRKTGYWIGNKDSKLFFNKPQTPNKAQNLRRVRPTPRGSPCPKEELQWEQGKGRVGPGRSLFSSTVRCPEEEEAFPNTSSCSSRNFCAFPRVSSLQPLLGTIVQLSRANFAFYSLRYK